MRIVVADASPIRYLVEIGHIELLPELFENVIIPSVVRDELLHPSAPEGVREWLEASPGWLEIMTAPANDDPALQALDEGERSAIALGVSLPAEIILIDDRRGATVARAKGFEILGTLGVLSLAARGRSLVRLMPAPPTSQAVDS
jgi:predicted nucleic acid-binding protein